MVQAEQSVIGCLMMAPELLDRARAVLSPAMFEAQPLARIFSGYFPSFNSYSLL